MEEKVRETESLNQFVEEQRRKEMNVNKDKTKEHEIQMKALGDMYEGKLAVAKEQSEKRDALMTTFREKKEKAEKDLHQLRMDKAEHF